MTGCIYKRYMKSKSDPSASLFIVIYSYSKLRLAAGKDYIHLITSGGL